MRDIRLLLVKWCPWWVLRGLWKFGIVERTTVFRWEVNQATDRWDGTGKRRSDG